MNGARRAYCLCQGLQRMLLKIASRLLDYPGEDFPELIQAAFEWLAQEAPKDIQNDWLSEIEKLQAFPLHQLREIYVATFDWKEKTGLYLTAHELGDSRKRGAALIKLQKLINDAGFERADGELSDYIPMLFEFLSVAEPSQATARLERRLSRAVYLISRQLETDHPYAGLFHLLLKDVFQPPISEELEALEREREEADLDELPYPLFFNT